MFSVTGTTGFNAFTDPPSSIPGLVSWYDAQNLTSITKDGSNNVSQWNDVSGGAYNAIQGTLANQPLYVASSNISSLPALRFNGTSSIMDITTFPTISSITIFAAIFVSSTATNRIYFSRRSKTASAPVAYQCQIVATTNLHTYTTRDDSNTNVAVATTSAAVTGGIVTTDMRSSNTISAWINNANVGTANAAPGNFGTITAPAPTIGATYAGTSTPTAFYNNDIGEVLMYNRALSTDERATVYLYLKTKWGL